MLIAVGIILSFTGCCEEFYTVGSSSAKTVGEDVKKQMIDTDNPTDINIAIGTQRVIGDDDVANALESYKDVRREDYKEQGDQAYRKDNYKLAIKYYEDALKWTDNQNKEEKAAIYKELASIYSGLAYREEEKAQFANRDEHYREAARNYIRSAENSTKITDKAYLYREAAYRTYRSGSRSGACLLLNQTMELYLKDPNLKNSVGYIESDKKQFGCKF